MNVATGGFGTEVTVKTDPKMKQQLGGAAYIITGAAFTSSQKLHSCLHLQGKGGGGRGKAGDTRICAIDFDTIFLFACAVHVTHVQSLSYRSQQVALMLVIT